MLKKTLIAISLISPLWAISATAHAGSTITDKSYWPSAARQSAQAPRSGLDSALAYDRPASVCSRLRMRTTPGPHGVIRADRIRGDADEENDAGSTMRGAIRDAHCAGLKMVAHAEASQAR
jgi:hypothetical protein